MQRSRILSEVHETASGLYRSGSIDKQTMREFDALALPQVRELSPKQIRALRARVTRARRRRERGKGPCR
jgi:putative transcriptional regulator